MSALTAERVDRFRAGFSGQIVTPADPQYDEARRVHNGLIDKRPALIARCVSPGDVASAITFGRELDLELSVRGGGHNPAGKAVTDGGLMIDLALMKETQVDAEARRITAGGGVTWNALNQAAHLHGLATTGGIVSTTGVAGLTLGGGVGWIMGKYAMAVDNLVSAEIVLASGEALPVSEQSEPDLFWAIRGGGGNFGVVTSFDYRAYPLETVLGGVVVHPLSAARDVFAFYRDFTASAPDELVAYAVLGHAPDASGAKICRLGVCHAGEDDGQAERDVRPLREFGSPTLDRIQRMPYPIMNTLLDDLFPRGTLNYWKSAFFAELTDDVVGKMTEAFEKAPTTMSFLVVEPYHGAVTRIDPTATAFPHRQPGYNCIIISQWTEPSQTDEGIRWARETFELLRPHMADRAYVNYLDQDDAGRVRAAYGPNYARLVELKRRYDPENVFRLNQNIAP